METLCPVMSLNVVCKPDVCGLGMGIGMLRVIFAVAEMEVVELGGGDSDVPLMLR